MKREDGDGNGDGDGMMGFFGGEIFSGWKVV